jgi:CheY-like chemotaxis protein
MSAGGIAARRVVVLSESAAERESITRILQRATFSVLSVGDAKAAVAAVGREAPYVVLFAWPSAGGPELARLLASADASRQTYLVALLDPASGGKDIQPALAAGVHDVLIRPFVDGELVGRLQAPARLARWTRAAAMPSALTQTTSLDVKRLSVWKNLGAIVAEDLAQLVGHPVQATSGWPSVLGGDLRCATVPMSLARDEVEVLVSVAADAPALAWLGSALLGDAPSTEAALNDVLREIASTAGGAVKRVAAPENVTLTSGIPVTVASVRAHGDGVAAFGLSIEGGRVTLAVVGEVRRRENRQVRASELCEGMVIVNDVRSESGALLVTAGSRLTRTTAERLARLLGAKVLVDVAA